MALVTYTLLSALASGLQSRFHPEVLGVSFSKAIGVVIAEFCAIKLGCYLLDVRGGGASAVELIGYGGYKFVGYVGKRPYDIWAGLTKYSIIVTILIGFLKFGRLSSGAVFAYTFFANFFFLVGRAKLRTNVSPTDPLDQLRSLKYVLLPDPTTTSAVTSTTLSHSQRSRRVQFLFVMAMSQVLWMGWLSRV